MAPTTKSSFWFPRHTEQPISFMLLLQNLHTCRLSCQGCIPCFHLPAPPSLLADLCSHCAPPETTLPAKCSSSALLHACVLPSKHHSSLAVHGGASACLGCLILCPSEPWTAPSTAVKRCQRNGCSRCVKERKVLRAFWLRGLTEIKCTRHLA